MEALWAITPPATAAIVVEALEKKTQWNPRTIKTMLNRLVKKKILTFEADGKRYLYKPLFTREQCIRSESSSFLHRIFGGEAGAMLAHFAQNEKLSREEIEELRQILDQKSQKK